ncbi:MAG: hypothetical protein JWN37_174 [Candidatus Nomurabacteria bacterium]|nr:hypothetical protein [Candidatus Nomurabacteria bacterium]
MCLFQYDVGFGIKHHPENPNEGGGMAIIDTKDSLEPWDFLGPDVSGPGSLKDAIRTDEEGGRGVERVSFHGQSPLHPVDSEDTLRPRDIFAGE